MLDDLDREILEALATDPCASMRTLAARIGSTAPTVSARHRRLIDLGAIIGRRLVLGPRATARFECITQDLEPPGVVLDRAQYADGRTRYTVLDADGLESWAAHHAVALHRIIDTPVDGDEPTANDDAATTASHPPTGRCHQCHGPLPERPIERLLNDRHHIFCCDTCAQRFTERLAERLRGT